MSTKLNGSDVTSWRLIPIGSAPCIVPFSRVLGLPGMMVLGEVQLSALSGPMWSSQPVWGSMAFDLLSERRALTLLSDSFLDAAGAVAVSGAFGRWHDGPGWVTFVGSPF